MSGKFLASEAMQVVGERYQEGTYFLPELIMSGEMLRKIGEILKSQTALGSEFLYLIAEVEKSEGLFHVTDRFIGANT